jgi:hypothetical protein
MTTEIGDRTSLLDRVGPLARRRAEPRFGVAVAGAGCVLAVQGAIVVGGDQSFGDDATDFNRWPGLLVCALVVAAGYLLLQLAPFRALGSAGTVAASLAVPPLVFFLTAAPDDIPPYSTEAILGASAAAWLVSYVVGPGRGHLLFLALGLVAAWLFAVQLVEEPFTTPFELVSVASSFDATGDAIDGDFGEGDAGDLDGDGIPDEFDDEVDLGPPDAITPDLGDIDEPDATTIGLISIVFGVGYLYVRRLLDRSGYVGTALGFVPPGLLALVSGIAALGDELEAAGTGIVFLVAGAFVAAGGAVAGRRGTTWVGGAMAGLGALLLVVDAEPDTAGDAGVLLLLAGAALVVVATLVADRLDEPPADVEGPSTWRRVAAMSIRQAEPSSVPPPGVPPALDPDAPSPFAPPAPPPPGPPPAPPERDDEPPPI